MRNRYALSVTHFIPRPLRSYAVTHFIPYFIVSLTVKETFKILNLVYVIKSAVNVVINSHSLYNILPTNLLKLTPLKVNKPHPLSDDR